MVITWSSDYIYVLAMLKTTPLVVTIGLSLTIPFAIVGDFLLNIPTALTAILGAILVLAAFVAIGVENSRKEETPAKVGVVRDSSIEVERVNDDARA
jgi:solute carrier family 35 protein F5